MRRLTVFLLAGLLWSAAAWADGNSATATAYFVVKGMTCGDCEAKVKKALRDYEGVIKVDASHKGGMARVVYDPAQVSDPSVLADRISEVGFTARQVDLEVGERRWKEVVAMAGKPKKRSCCASKSKKGCASKAKKSGCGTKAKKEGCSH